MYKVTAKKKNKREVNTAMDGGLIIGHFDKDKEKLVFEMVGEMSFDDVLNDMASAVYYLMEYTNDQTGGRSKDKIYDRVNQALSLILDKYDPQRKHKKTHGTAGVLTDQDIIRMENKKLHDKPKKK